MTVRADVEQIQSTRTEKLLAVVLSAFLLLGGVWTYTRLDNVVRSHEPLPRTAFGQGPAERTFQQASFRLSRARALESAALRQLVLKREAYRNRARGAPAGREARCRVRRLAGAVRGVAACRQRRQAGC